MIKEIIKKTDTNNEQIPKTNDKAVEKKFKDKEIEDALTALKAKCSTKKTQPEKIHTQNEQKLDNNISNEEIDSSLQNLLKNLDK